ncbi:MAG: hypothetical protein MZV64_64765 [Ignavibacteriales bacterium]|nr:hypothetical protein [Ignavibacteriales bacterium]
MKGEFKELYSSKESDFQEAPIYSAKRKQEFQDAWFYSEKAKQTPKTPSKKFIERSFSQIFIFKGIAFK